ncbi:hypothetical protein TNCV_1836511 [Trichonephila clavipes]|nr:hypothetical protein TNCV_1836511 [Trichonephila clavipes]
MEEVTWVCTYANATDCNRWLEDANDKPKNQSLQLSLVSIFTAILYFCMGSLVSLSDASCFNILGAHPELYGRQRMWGTIGWGSFALLSGFLNQLFTHVNQANTISHQDSTCWPCFS